jgi:acyl transferase domain-containing protein/phosphopantetheinyl transferase
VSSHSGAPPTEGVAITGMACLFPGACDVDAYWRNILGKVDATSDPPPEAWDPDIYYDPEFKDVDRTYCKRGGYLGAMARFDPLAHGVPPVAVGGEPDQWLALQVARDALADTGRAELPEEVRARTAVVFGKGTYLNGGNAIAVQRGLVIGQTIDLIRRLHPERSEEQLQELREALQEVLPPLGPETVPGLIPNIIVGRIANRLDLMGPAYTIDAACASSLVAVQHAVRDLLAGDCDLALAGGSQVWMPVATLNLFCRLGALSRSERLRAFDKHADGTLLGEGIGAVVLKRAQDAVRDGDRVYAVIRGVGVASDGHGMSVMAPRIEGEELALRRAYAAAGVSPATIGLVEAHGTGTPVGDVTEVQALTRVFGEREGELPRCALGTVKTMIGHTIPAAGVAGLIKTALALHQRVLPPTLGCEEPNPELGLERTPFYINTETRPWIHGDAAPRRAGINAFGFGGINAHAVLEEWDGEGALGHRPPRDAEVCILAGESQQQLLEAAGELHGALAGAGGEIALADLAFTLGRELDPAPGRKRLALVASDTEDLRGKLGQAIEKLREPDCARIKTTSGIYYEAEPLGRDASTVFVFPGEGAQYQNMLAGLCLEFAEARAAFDRIDRLYAEHPRGHRLSDWVFPRPAFADGERERTEARLMELDIAVEAVLTANAAVHGVIRRLVPRCDAMLGHSSGEHSAAMAAGALDVETDERLAAFCHGLYASYADAAARHDVPAAVLLALGADAATAERIAREAGGELHLAMDNCPHQAVLVGEAAAAARAYEIATREGLMCEQLPYDRAVHTPMFAPFAEDLRATFARLPVRAAAIELWSCTTAAAYPKDPDAIRELLVEHWTRPVRFRETIEALHDDGARVFLEVGPRGNMTSFMQDILRGRPACVAASDLRRRTGVTQLSHLVGMLAAHDVELDLGYLFEQRHAELLDWRAPASDAALRPRAIVPLSTTWPMLRLSDEAVQRLRAPASNGAAAWRGSSATPSPSSSDPAHAASAARDGALARSTPGEPEAAPPAVAPAPAPATAPAPIANAAPATQPGALAAPSEDVAAAVDGYLETMERFLVASEEVMSAYLGGGAAVALEQARRPLVGTIIAWEPETELVAQRVVDPLADRYLLDHTLGGRVSRADPGLHALALMPLAMSIEILAEGASCLLPDLVVTGVRDLRAHRWLAFGHTPQTLEVSARRLPAESGCERARVELRCLADGAAADPVVEATVLLSDDHPSAPAAAAAAFDGAGPPRRLPEQLYGEVMFHGPLWQGVRSVETIAPEGARASLQVLPRTGLLAGSDEPAFVLDPVALDAAGQVVGFWAADTLERARVVFPFALAALDLYAPPPPAGETLDCVASIARVGEQLLSAEIDVRDARGHCLMRLAGWQDKRFDVPDRFAPLARASELAPLSEPWPAPLAPYPAARAACRRLDARLPADRGLWEPVWASRVLGRRERELFDELSHPEARRLEWLAARTAAKECVAELLRDAHGLELLPAEIEILPDERGAPVVHLATLPDLDECPVVSLAHAHGRAAALATLAPARAAGGVGIDLELLVPRPHGFAQAALSEAELRLLEPLPAQDAEEWLLRAWCAREAAGKACGSGLAGGAEAPRVSSIDSAHETVAVDVAGRRLSVCTHREADVIVATALDPEPALDRGPLEAMR